MNSNVLRLALLIILATFGVKVLAHSRLKDSGSLIPRSADPGIKLGPCGPAAKNVNPPAFAPGQSITVNWEETINHPGRYLGLSLVHTNKTLRKLERRGLHRIADGRLYLRDVKAMARLADLYGDGRPPPRPLV